MSTFRFTTQIDDGIIRLPADVKLAPGMSEITIVQPPRESDPSKSARTSLADWADQHAEHWGKQLSAADVSSFTGRGY